MIEKLAYLVALAREGSFRRAAEACGVAQPSLSGGIRQLEEQLGVMLVRRSSRMHGFTPEGEKVLEWARRLVSDAQAMRQEVHTMRQGLSGTVRLAVVPTALSFVPRLVAPFAARHPALTFSIQSCSAAQIQAMVENLEAEAGITYLAPEPQGRLRHVAFYDERYLLITADEHAFAGRTHLSWTDLADLPLCLLSEDMQNRRIIERRMRAVGLEPRPRLVSNSQITLIAHVLAGGWATVLPEQIAGTLALSPRLRCLKLTDEEGTLQQIGLVVADREPMPLLSAALLAEARQLER